jgi:hypothetical protein
MREVLSFTGKIKKIMSILENDGGLPASYFNTQLGVNAYHVLKFLVDNKRIYRFYFYRQIKNASGQVVKTGKIFLYFRKLLSYEDVVMLKKYGYEIVSPIDKEQYFETQEKISSAPVVLPEEMVDGPTEQTDCVLYTSKTVPPIIEGIDMQVSSDVQVPCNKDVKLPPTQVVTEMGVQPNAMLFSPEKAFQDDSVVRNNLNESLVVEMKDEESLEWKDVTCMIPTFILLNVDYLEIFLRNLMVYWVADRRYCFRVFRGCFELNKLSKACSK